MAEFGRAALTIAGFAIGGPLGALAGGLIGSLIFRPDDVEGPRLNELNFQRSTVGAPIPLVYGTAALAGNVIWSSGLIETKHTDEQGGFFGIGETKINSYTYAVDVAIGVCEGPISGYRRIWADADPIYDARTDAEIIAQYGDTAETAEYIAGLRALSSELDVEFYLGTEDQLPDPTIQSYENVGYVVNVVPAYRGYAYVVLRNFQLEKYGNRIPNFRFEVVSSGTAAECGSYSVGHMEPWQYMLDPGVFDPRNPDNQHLYAASGSATAFPATDSFSVAMAAMDAEFLGSSGASFVCGEIPQVGDSQYIWGWARSATPNFSQPCDAGEGGAPSFADTREVTINLNVFREDAGSCASPGGCTGVQDTLLHNNDGDASGFRYANLNNTGPPPFVGPWDNRGDCTIGSDTYQMWAIFDQEMNVRRWWAPTDLYGRTWTRVSGTFRALRHYDDAGSMFGSVLSYPKDPTLRSDHPSYNDQAFWESAYAAAVAENDSLSLIDPNRIPEDWIYGVDYPTAASSHTTNLQSGIVWELECTAIAVDCVPMADIVADICRRAGLRTDSASQIDVSDLTTCVSGYIIGRQMSARDALLPLRRFGLWDATESGAVLKFVERGHALVATLTEDDLGVYEHNGTPPTAVESTRIQEKELPRRVRVHFANFEKDHESSQQAASRTTTEAVEEVDITLPISMTPDTAAQLADIFLYEAWYARDTYTFSLDNAWLALEPSDCVEIPVDGETERVRIVAIDYSIGGIIKVQAVRDDDGSYTSTAVAEPGTPSGGGPFAPGSGPLCATQMVVLDIPYRELGDDAGYWVALYALCDSWACAEVYRSADGGLTYGRVARTDLEATVGTIDLITGPPTDFVEGDTSGYDTSSVITVTLYEGTLSSVTDEQIAAGQNTAAIGVDGRWVIIQYKTAVLDTGDQWTLSDIVWGLYDTAHLLGTTGDGDTFVLLSDSALIRVPESPDVIGEERLLKAVTCGLTLDATTAVEFTTWGLSYQRPCPQRVLSASVTSPPSNPDDGDSYLLANDTSLDGAWQDHGGEIATWSDETGAWVFCTPVPGTIVHVDDDTSGGGDVISGGDGTYTPSPWAQSTKTYITRDDERLTLPNSLRIADTDTVTWIEGTDGTIEAHAIGVGGDTGGGGGVAGGIGCELRRVASFSTPTANTDYPIPWDTEDFDDGGFWAISPNPTRVTVPATGWYVMAGNASFALGGSTHALSFAINGAAFDATDASVRQTGSGSINQRYSITSVQYLTSGDYIELIARPREAGTSVDGARIGVVQVGDISVGGDTSDTGGGGTGDVSGPASSTDNAIVRWDGTTGELIQDSDTTLSDADELTTPNASAAEIGFKGIPYRSISADTTLVLTDAGSGLIKDSGGAITLTIPANGSVAFPVGTAIEVINDDSEIMTVAITTDTLVLSPNGATGSRSVAARGMFTLRKVAATRWYITGAGVT